MSFRKRLAAVIAVAGVASLVTFLQVEANHETDDQIGDEAVWNAGKDDLRAIDQTCENSSAARYSECFIDQMGGYASSDAVAFTQMLASQKPQRLGYLTGMRESGIVDLGYVAYPGNTRPSRGWALMNGVPALINVDDLSLLPKAEMEKDAHFKALRNGHPTLQLAVSDEQRQPGSSPQIEALGEGGNRFVVPYSLKEDCTSCVPLARASFGFDFDAAGQFMGVKFLGIESLNRQSQEPRKNLHTDVPCLAGMQTLLRCSHSISFIPKYLMRRPSRVIHITYRLCASADTVDVWQSF